MEKIPWISVDHADVEVIRALPGKIRLSGLTLWSLAYHKLMGIRVISAGFGGEDRTYVRRVRLWVKKGQRAQVYSAFVTEVNGDEGAGDSARHPDLCLCMGSWDLSQDYKGYRAAKDAGDYLINEQQSRCVLRFVSSADVDALALMSKMSALFHEGVRLEECGSADDLGHVEIDLVSDKGAWFGLCFESDAFANSDLERIILEWIRMFETVFELEATWPISECRVSYDASVWERIEGCAEGASKGGINDVGIDDRSGKWSGQGGRWPMSDGGSER